MIGFRYTKQEIADLNNDELQAELKKKREVYYQEAEAKHFADFEVINEED